MNSYFYCERRRCELSWLQIPPYLIGCFVIGAVIGYMVFKVYFKIKSEAINYKGSNTSVNKATLDTPKPPVVKKINKGVDCSVK